MLLGLASCKDTKSDENTGTGAGDGEKYTNEQGQSDATETGQHIGSNADSTTVDGEPGNPSSD
jgi:hypothetical protein